MKTAEEKHKKLFFKRLLDDLDKAKENGDVEELYKMGKNYIKIIEVQTQLSESYYKKWKREVEQNTLGVSND